MPSARRDVFVPQTCEVTQLDNPGRDWIFDSEPGQGFVQREDVIRGHGRRSVGQLHPLEHPAVLPAVLAPRRLNKDAPHGLGRGGEEVAAAVPVLDLFDIHQPEVRLMDQSCGLECLPGFLVGELLPPVRATRRRLAARAAPRHAGRLVQWQPECGSHHS